MDIQAPRHKGRLDCPLHKAKPDRAPTRNCHKCWDVYFFNHPERAAAVAYGLRKHGREKVIEVMGVKYVKQVERFQKEHNIGRDHSG